MRTPAYFVKTTFNIVCATGGPFNFPEKIDAGCYLSCRHPSLESAKREILEWHSRQAKREGWRIAKVVESVNYEIVS